MVQKTIRMGAQEATTTEQAQAEKWITLKKILTTILAIVVLGGATTFFIFLSIDLFNNVDMEDKDIFKKVFRILIAGGALILGLIFLAILLSFFYWEYVA